MFLFSIKKKMAWNYNTDGEDEKVTIYDLRQTYAKILDYLLNNISIARKAKNFPELFDWLEDLETQIEQKLKREEIQKYNEILNETHEHIKKHQSAFLGKSKDPEEIYHIRSILRRMEKHLYKLMEKHKMFGAKEEAELI